MAARNRRPEPQFPAPTVPAGDEVAGVERLPEPAGRARELIALHLREEHGVQRFRLDRYVHLGGPRCASQVITWLPAQAGFLCEHCPGMVFTAGELTDELLALAEAFDESLQPLLVGLTDPEDRKQMVRLQRDGTLNRLRLEEANQAAYRDAIAHSRPSVQERRERLQALMLDEYAELGVVARVLDAIEDLQRADRERWQQLAGRPLSRRTLHDYWRAIDRTRVARARERFERQHKR